MSADPVDTRPTDYLFGELSPEEVAAFESRLEESAELRAEVDALRDSIVAVRSELATQTGIGEAARAEVEQAIESVSQVEPSQRRSSRHWSILAAIAASLLLATWFAFDRWIDRQQVAVADKMHAKPATLRDFENESPHRESHQRMQELIAGRQTEFAIDREHAEVTARSAELSDGRETAPRFGVTPKVETLSADPVVVDDDVREGLVPSYAVELTERKKRSSPTGQNHLLFADGESRQRGLVRGGEALGRRGEALSQTWARRYRDLDKGVAIDSAGFGEGPGNAGDRHDVIVENPFVEVKNAALSTVSVDVDTAAYAKVRMSLMQHQQLPRRDAVRIEELVNYFDYGYLPPKDEQPFAARMQISECPWNRDHRLARIGIKGRVDEQRPASNLVFLIDVSGSMNRSNKLPLVIDGLKMLVDQLNENDSVAIVVYASATGLVLDSTAGDQKQAIHAALDRLQAGGSTNGGAGIQLAYQIARDHFQAGATNRVILCTDGDFNVGVTGKDQLVRIAEENAKSNIYLSMLGFGMGNHNDDMMEAVSNKGNGNYAFIDDQAEARKVLVEEMGGTLHTIAKNVKLQVEFNPQEIRAYRLIGYENRVMAAEDFNDDKKDAGEIGAGHTVTVLFELVPTDSPSELSVPPVDDLRYQRTAKLSKAAQSGELLTLKIRYQAPDSAPGAKSTLIEFPVKDDGKAFDEMDRDFQFAASVAAFGMLLRDSAHKGDATYAAVQEIAAGAVDDKDVYRSEFLEMVERAKSLSGE